MENDQTDPQPARRVRRPHVPTVEGATVWIAWAGVYESRRLVAVCSSELAALRALVGIAEDVDVEPHIVKGAEGSEVEALREILKVAAPID